jgi:hypothetical protein
MFEMPHPGSAPADAPAGRDARPLPGSVKVVRSFVAILSAHPGTPPPGTRRLQRLPGWCATHLVSADRRAELAFAEAEEAPRGAPPPGEGNLTLLVGDDAEWREAQGRSCMAAAACVTWNPMRSSLRVLSSVVALPPLFIYRGPGVIAIASELALLRAIRGSRFTIDPQAAVQLFKVGYPLDHRTLFTEVTLMPGGHSFRVEAAGRIELTRSWDPPAPQPATSPSSHVSLQVEAFREAVSTLELSGSLLSLTGGLDTRAILAALSEARIALPACTLSGGPRLSLDARMAEVLCRAYRLPHVVVTLDQRFLKDLPRYLVEASQLSGGLASLEQAHEVYFYEQLQGLGSRRLSGHVGNQIGRQHLERISMRGADTRVLHDAIRMAAGEEPSEHWLIRAGGSAGHTLTRSLIEYEVPFASLSNYSIGHHFMIQQSPYANRRLIEASLKAAADGREGGAFQPRRARLNALAHRFVGQPRTRSFQRKLIEATGGAVADFPINWGWRARGGVSAKGLGWGLLAFADSMSSRTPRLARIGRQSLRLLGAEGMGEITQYPRWLNTVLRDFVNDTLRSRLVTQSGLFDAARVARLSDEHYRGTRSHYTTLVATLDLALAQQVLAAPSSADNPEDRAPAFPARVVGEAR